MYIYTTVLVYNKLYKKTHKPLTYTTQVYVYRAVPWVMSFLILFFRMKPFTVINNYTLNRACKAKNTHNLRRQNQTLRPKRELPTKQRHVTTLAKFLVPDWGI